MTDTKPIDDGTKGSAFPFTPSPQPMLPDGRWDQNYDPGDSGLTPREYAAIHLRVPDDKIPSWLRDMILEARRMDYAGQAMQGIFAESEGGEGGYTRRDYPNIVKWSDGVADAMLAERKRGGE